MILKLIKNCKNKIENKRLLNQYPPNYILNYKAYDVYRLSTKKNQNITYDEARLKLNKNIYLAESTRTYCYNDKEHIITYYYEKLVIKVDEVRNEIIFVKHTDKMHSKFYKDNQLYKKISRAYGLM